MKKLKTVLQFELSNYLQNKTFLVTSLLIVVIITIVMFLPRFIDMSDLLGTGDDTKQSSEEEKTDSDKEKTKYVIYDKTGTFTKMAVLEESFPDSEWKALKSADEVKKQVKSQKAQAGFVVNSLTEYEHFVHNKNLDDMDMIVFDELLAQAYRISYCEENNLPVDDVMKLVNVTVEGTEEILGKDMSDSFAYCYILVVAVFMIIILYGVMIATSVTTEKSNRSIEVLVTSTTSNSLIFGKVLAGTIAAFVQIGLILLAAVGGYAINYDYWNGKLDAVLNIPGDVLFVFGLFMLFGFIFYASIYAAVGALVSKTEDINKTAGSVQMIIMIVYFLVLFQMSNIDGTIMKVLSFLPVSSYSAMYIRVAMGNVAVWEIVVSLLILIASTGLVGYIAAKIYRMGTLRYGNPISIRSALKTIRNKSAE